VSEVGETVTELPVTVPIPLLTLKEIALDADHDKVLDWPMVITEGDAEKEVMVGLPGALMVTVVWAVAVPVIFVAVKV
jgi:hypothetical protein